MKFVVEAWDHRVLSQLLSNLKHPRSHPGSQSSHWKRSKVKCLLSCIAAVVYVIDHMKNRHCLSRKGHCYELYLGPGFSLSEGPCGLGCW